MYALATKCEPTSPESLGVIDVEQLMRNVDGDTVMARDLVLLFLAELPAMVKRFAVSAELGDAKGVSEYAHKLKGSLLTIAAPRAVVHAAALERMARAESLNHVLSELELLQYELVGVQEFLEHLTKCPDGLIPESFNANFGCR